MKNKPLEYFVDISHSCMMGESFIYGSLADAKASGADVHHFVEKQAYDELEARLEEILSYMPKVPTQPYGKMLAEQTDKFKKALNKIAILGSSEMAYTRDFTESVNMIAREALNDR